MKKDMRIMERNSQTDTGKLQINVQSTIRNVPIENARIQISYTGDPTRVIEETATDESGQSPILDLAAPPLDYSLEPGEIQPYSEYTLNVTAPGYTPFDISGVEILATATALQPVYLEPQEAGGQFDNLVIPAHTLYGDYPPKIPEEEIKPIDETGEIVLSRVVVPEYVVVHDGVPSDSTARDYYVRYKDYIKNVASSEIYATWPADTIRANVLAIMSFTLNRVYTEWYRNVRCFGVG